MAVDINMLNMHITAFKKAVKFVNENKKEIEGTPVEAAFDTLKDHWRRGNFEPTEMAELIAVIKKNLKLFSVNRDFQAELKSFSSNCEIYYTQDEDKFDAFQAVMQNKTPLDASIILRLYEKIFGSLQNTVEYEEIHKKTNGNTLYQLFGFEPDSTVYKINKLRVLLEDKGEFSKDVISKKGKWEDLKLFANVLKDQQSKDNYDAYYRFLRCKKILKGVHSCHKNLVSKNYIETVGELEKYKICQNSGEAAQLLTGFCTEIGLQCIPITAEQFAEQEKRIEGLRKRIEEKVNQLKDRQKNIESSLNGMEKEMDTLLSDIDSEISKMSSILKTLKNSTEAIYKESHKLKVLEQQVADLQKLKRKIKEVESSCNETKKNIAKEVKNADDKQEEITFDNVQAILNEVNDKEKIINKLFADFTNKYNKEIKTDVQEGFRNAKSKFYNTEREITTNRETLKNRAKVLNTEINQQNKPITARFIIIQIILLLLGSIIFLISNSGLTVPDWFSKIVSIIFYLNIILLILYIIFVCKQFRNYNSKVAESYNYDDFVYKPKDKKKIYIINKKTGKRSYGVWIFVFYPGCGLPLPFVIMYFRWHNAQEVILNDKVKYYTQGRLIWNIIRFSIFFVLTQTCFQLLATL